MAMPEQIKNRNLLAGPLSNDCMSTPGINARTIDSFIEGEVAAFGQIYDQTAKLIYNVVLRIVTNEKDAEDITQDTYVQAFEKRGSFNGLSDISTWLYRIAVNRALNFCKRKKYVAALSDSLAYFLGGRQNENDLQSMEDENRDILLVKKLLGKINPDFRTCIVLCEIENKSYQQIADILGINIGTVRSRINRGKVEIKELYKRMGERNET